MTTQDTLSKQVAKKKALNNRIAKLNKLIKKEKDPAKKAKRIAKVAELTARRDSLKTKIKDTKTDISVEGVTGEKNRNAAEAAAAKYTPTLDRVHTGVTGYDPTTGNPIRIGENQEVLDRFRNVMEKGMDAPEYQAEREQMSAGLNSNYRTSQI